MEQEEALPAPPAPGPPLFSHTTNPSAETLARHHSVRPHPPTPPTHTLSANLGQAPARQAALKAGLPFSADCTTVNKVCSSGMKALTIAAASLQLGVAQVAVAGGMESMSNIPYYVPSARGGARLGHAQLVDGMVADGLWDPHHDIHMGECAELCAEEHGITRAEQDAHALESAARARAAQAGGVTAWEVVPVEVTTRRGTAVVSQVGGVRLGVWEGVDPDEHVVPG